jgi:hypothetical protein
LSNQDENRQFHDAVLDIERNLGRKLSRPEKKRLHREVLEWDLAFTIWSKSARICSGRFDMKAGAIKIRQYFQPLFGARPVRVKLGVGSFLTFEFGPRTKAYGHLLAQWRLWIYLSNWKLYHGDYELVNSDADRKKITRIAHRLEEEASLSDVDFDPVKRKTTFSFDDFRLVVSPADYLENVNNRDDYWIFFMPDNEVLAAGPSGIQVEPGNPRPSVDGKKQKMEIQETNPKRIVRLTD